MSRRNVRGSEREREIERQGAERWPEIFQDITSSSNSGRNKHNFKAHRLGIQGNHASVRARHIK